jgi:hypothetical protein
MNPFYAGKRWTDYAYRFFVGLPPLGYALVQMTRDQDSVWTRPYVDQYPGRPISSEVTHCIHDELDTFLMRQKHKLKFPLLNVRLTDEMEPRSYGSFIAKNGAEVQIPTRAAILSVQELRQMFPSLTELVRRELPTLPLSAKASKITDADLQGIILTDRARRFLLSREYQNVKNVTQMMTPIALWFVAFGPFMFILERMYPFFTAPLSMAICISVGSLVFYGTWRSSQKQRTASLDRKVCDVNDEYLRGCREYLQASMHLGRILHKHLQLTDNKVIKANGDFVSHPVPYSQRLRLIDQWDEETTIQPKRKNFRNL